METKFQTSFIPKKPLTQTSSTVPVERHSASILFLIGIFVFVISLSVAGGSFAWQEILEGQNNKYKTDLQTLEQNFNIDRIIELKQASTKIELANGLLRNHVALSRIFGVISNITAANVRFTSLDLQAPADRSKGINMKMNGYTQSYDTLAFQSDQLGHLEDLKVRDYLSNPVISNPVQNQNSTVSFELSATIKPDSMLYSKKFQTQ